MSLIHEKLTLSPDERQALIHRYIAPDPHHLGIAHYVLREYGISVWALVAYVETVGHDLDRVAGDYDIPVEQVRAALAFYAEHADAIDTYLASRRTV
jgi:uncharacterized protein (DUF433 family)